VLDDREAEPGATGRASAVGAEEALEQARHVLVGDSGAVVCDLEHNFAFRTREADCAGRPFAGVPQRVLEQVLDHEPEHPAAERHLDRLVPDAQGERQSRELGALGELGNDVAQDGCGLRLAQRNHLTPLLELAQEEDVVDEISHLHHLLARPREQRLQVGAGKLGRLEQRLEPRERRAQLVGDRGGERRTEGFVVGVGH